VFAVIARTKPSPPMLPPLPPMSVCCSARRRLLRRRPPPPLKPTPDPGGGKPAAPSRIHVTPKPPPKAELPARPDSAPEPALVIGAAPVASRRPAWGRAGGEWNQGTGNGDGEGAGFGRHRPPVCSRRHPGRDFQRHSRAAAAPAGGSVNCIIRLDQRLDRLPRRQ
jgi:protein TonB